MALRGVGRESEAESVRFHGHAKDQKSRGEGWFEVIAGKSMPEEGVAKCFAYVQTYDTKPKRRLLGVFAQRPEKVQSKITG